MSAAELRTDLGAGELDCLAVLWQAREEGSPALKLSEIHRRIQERREKTGESSPALTTVSTHLRTLLAKGLLREVTVGGSSGQGPPQTFVRDARGLIPTSRSPKTGYEAAHEPGVVLEKTFKALADAYPPEKRMQALVDFARALGLTQKAVKELEKWLQGKLSP